MDTYGGGRRRVQSENGVLKKNRRRKKRDHPGINARKEAFARNKATVTENECHQPDVREILFNKSQLTSIVQRVAGEIARDYSGHESKLVLVGILRGAVVFMTDLMRELPFPVEIDFMRVSSYGGGTTSSGKINIKLDLMPAEWEERYSHRRGIMTAQHADLSHRLHKSQSARSVRSCVMFDKPSAGRSISCTDYAARSFPKAS